jgi:hypothetical protein
MAKNVIFILSLFATTSLFPDWALAEEKIELRTTTIKGNKELPKILYLVPWKDIKHSKHDEQKLELHSLFGDLFDPVLPKKPQNKLQ